MTHAYDEVLKEKACDNLGKMLDFAVYSLHMDADNMLALFAASGVSTLFEKGDIRVIVGMSGIELAYVVLDRCGISYERTPARQARGLSAEYHLGNCIADIQYSLSLSFAEILKSFSCRDFLSGYADSRTEFLSSLPLSISSEERNTVLLEFGRKYSAEAAGNYVKSKAETDSSKNTGSLLKNARIKNGLSQSALAKAANVPLRTLQQYEQGQKDIRKARAEYLVSLASALNTEPSKLIPRFPSV